MSDSKHELNLEEIGKEEEAYGQFEALDTREALKHRGKRGYRILRHVDTARTSDDERLLQTILTDIHQIRSELDHLREENSQEEVFDDKPEKSPLADTPQNKLFSLNTESDVLTVEQSVEDEQNQRESQQDEEIHLSDNIEEVRIEPVDTIELQMTEANMQKMGILDSDELKEFELDSLAMPHHERFNDVDIDIPLDNYPADLEAEASVTASLSKIAYESKMTAEQEQPETQLDTAEQEILEDIQVPLESLLAQNKPQEEISTEENISAEQEAEPDETEIDPLDAVLPLPEPAFEPTENIEEEMASQQDLSAEESVMASLMKAAENAAMVEKQQEKEVLQQEEEQEVAQKELPRTEEDILSEFDFSDLEGPAKQNDAAVGNTNADILGEDNLSNIILENDNIVSTELTSLPSSDKLVELLQRPVAPMSCDDLDVVIPVGPMFDGDLSSVIPSHNLPIHAEEESYAVVQQAQALDKSALKEMAEAQIESVNDIIPEEEQQQNIQPEEQEIAEPELQEELEEIDAQLSDEQEEPILEADFVEAEEEIAEDEQEIEQQEEASSSESDFSELEEPIAQEEITTEEAEDELQADIETEEELETQETTEEAETEAVLKEEPVPQEEAESASDMQEESQEIQELGEEPSDVLEEVKESGALEADLDPAGVEDPEIVNEIADEVLSTDVLDALEKASQMHTMPSTVSALGATQFSYDQDLFNDLEAFIGFFENIFAKIPQDEQMRLAETLGYAAYLRVKGKVERESLRQVTSSMLDSLTLDDLENPEDNKEDTSPLARYREDAMQRGRIPFVLEMNRETLIAQIVVLSEDEVDMQEADAQWVSFLKDFLHSEGFVISSEMHTIVISSRPLEMSENDYLESLINDASDVFGVQPDESLFEPFFIPLDNQMVKKLSAQIQV